MSDPDRPAVARTSAEVRRGWWPGWIWAIPVAALILVGWWALRTFLLGGEDITISFADAHGMKPRSTSVVYRGMEIGKVSELALAKDGNGVTATVQIDETAAKLLTTGTLFWLRGASPSLSDPSSLSALLSGPTIVMEAGPGKPTKHFVGLVQRPVISGAHGPPQIYRVMLSGTVGRLSPGEPVKLRGFTVGEVRDIGFRYDAMSGKIETPVTLALYPKLFHIEKSNSSEDEAALKTAIDRMVGEGLRAQLQRDPPLIGSPEVTLDVMPGEKGATLATVDGVPQIPAASGGDISSIVDRINKVPVDQIARNVDDIAHHVDQLVASPALADAISQLDATLAELHKTTSTAGPQITTLVVRLRQTAGRLDDALRSVKATAKTAQHAASAADNVLGGAPSQDDAQKAMREITEAARSVRELADFLDRHPEALIQGRSGE